jgi:hypothetical protein
MGDSTLRSERELAFAVPLALAPGAAGPVITFNLKKQQLLPANSLA